MRITSGIARGMNLKAPSDLRIRPMPERMKRALYSSLGETVVGARLLDLFAGSGCIGLEALSRGAGFVVFVDSGREANELIAHNLSLLARGMETKGRSQLVRADVFEWLHRAAGQLEPFDLIIADPPYPKTADPSLAHKVLQEPSVVSMLRDDGWLIVGHSKRDPIRPAPWWEPDRQLAHGDCVASFFRKKVL